MATILMVFILLLGSNRAIKMTKESIDVVLTLSDKLRSKESVFIGYGGVSIIKELSRAKIYSIIMSSRKLEKLQGNLSSRFSTRILVVEIMTDKRSCLANISMPFLFHRIVIDKTKKIKEEKLPHLVGKSSFHLIEYNKNRFRLSEVFKNEIISEEFYYLENANTTVKFKREFNGKRFNFHGHPLVVAMHSSKGCDAHELHPFKKGTCLHDEIVKSMAYRLNFTIIASECLDKCMNHSTDLGSRIKGLVTMLLDGTADLCTNTFVFNPVSKMFRKDIDYILPTYTIKVMIYFKKPEFNDNWDSYLRPFQRQIWYATVAMITASAWIFLLFERMHLRCCRREKSPIFLSDCFLNAFGIFCNQFGPGFTDFVSSRMYRFGVMLLAIILYSVYNSALLFSLAFYQPSLPFTDLNGFFLKGNYKITAVQGTYLIKYLQEEMVLPKNSRRENFVADIQKLPHSAQKGIDQICKDHKLTFVEFKNAVMSVKRFECEIVETPSPIFVYYWGIGLPFGSPYREHFNRELTYLRSIGLLQKFHFQFKLTSDMQLPSIKKEDFFVDFFTFFPIFAAFSFGVVVSSCIFVGELITNKMIFTKISTKLSL